MTSNELLALVLTVPCPKCGQGVGQACGRKTASETLVIHRSRVDLVHKQVTDSALFPLRGHVRVFQQDNPSNVLVDMGNVICNTVKSLFARMMADISEPEYGVWGLALGLGDAGWTAETTPDPTALQTALIAPRLRKRLSTVRFVDDQLNPVAVITEKVDFQTIVNATTDDLNGVAIREMGLIGGGSKQASTQMGSSNTAFWDLETADPDSVTLINYKTLPPLLLPPGVNFIFSWVLTF